MPLKLKYELWQQWFDDWFVCLDVYVCNGKCFEKLLGPSFCHDLHIGVYKLKLLRKGAEMFGTDHLKKKHQKKLAKKTYSCLMGYARQFPYTFMWHY